MNFNDYLSPKIVGNSSLSITDFSFELDFLVTSPHFRRLQDKAQIFPLESGDFTRTRLTHSIECMAAAEMLGNNVLDKLQSDFISTHTNEQEIIDFFVQTRNIPIVLKTAALIHDIGNPPFGHIAEGIISSWFSKNLDFIFYNDKEKIFLFDDTGKLSDNPLYKNVSSILKPEQKYDLFNFEGNAQLIRILSCLIKPNKNKGFSAALVSTCRKYLSDSVSIESYKSKSKNMKKKEYIGYKKLGYFTSEKDYINDLNLIIPNTKKRNPMAFLLEATDDISYITSDIEDGFKKGLVSYKDIQNVVKRSLSSVKSSQENKLFSKDLLDYIDKNKTDTETTINLVRDYLKKKLIDAVAKTFVNNIDDLLSGNFTGELLEKSDASILINKLRDLLEKKVYYSQQVAIQKTKVFTILNTLLRKLVMGSFSCLKDDKNLKDVEPDISSKLFSKNYRIYCKKRIKECSDLSDKIFACLQLAVDEISGMTDLYAMKMYNVIIAK